MSSVEKGENKVQMQISVSQTVLRGFRLDSSYAADLFVNILSLNNDSEKSWNFNQKENKHD